MKVCMILAVVITSFIRCSSVATSPAVTLEGIYISQAASEFSKAFDTVTISSFNPGAATYVIIRKTGFCRINNGVLQPKQYKIEQSTGLLDDGHLQLKEQKKGTLYSFTSSGDELLVGSTRYKKIN